MPFMNQRPLRAFTLCLAVALACAPAVVSAQSRPAIAVLDFSTRGLSSDWYGGFEPGVALSDLVTDRMVNDGRFNVVDRTHLTQTLGEHQLASGGEVDPQT